MFLLNFILLTLLANVWGNYELKEIYVLGRHNVRTPLSQFRNLITPKPWPSWNASSEHLTPRGKKLERLLGEYFNEWFKAKNLVVEKCNEDVLVYSNAKKRTLQSASNFIETAFSNCSIIIAHNKDVPMETHDPIFAPYVHSSDENFIKLTRNEIMKKVNNTKLEAWKLLQEILDFDKSEVCKTIGFCDLYGQKFNVLNLSTGAEPKIGGSFNVSVSAIDTFWMEFYEGMDEKDIAWGLINNTDAYTSLKNAKNIYYQLLFDYRPLSSDIAQPMIQFIKQQIDKQRKITYIFGHDTNLMTILNTLDVKHYELEDSLDLFPVGSKLMFQKWSKDGKDFFKMEYFYLTSNQIRNVEKLSLENPPKSIQIFLSNCVPNEDGFCTWKEFLDALDRK